MLDTPTTAFYHGPNQQNVKNLFSAIPAISSSLPALVNLSFSSYFQQPSQQETKFSSSIETSSSSSTVSNDLNSAPTAPQQPTHTNRRTQRRVAQKQQNSISSTKSTTVPQRVVAVNNMGNVNSPVAQPSKTPSMITTPSSSSSTTTSSSSHHHHHHHHRRRKHSNKINRKKVDEAITLSAFAVEEDNQGNHDVAIEFYLSAIENMLDALPIHSNQTRKDALKNKLRDFMDREGLTDDFMESTNASSVAKAIEREENKSNPNNRNSGPGISDHIIQAAITSAVALKQSPIPDAISATVNYTMRKIQKIDQTYGLQHKAWEISRSGINKALEIDQQYNVHQKVGNAFFVGIAAAMKAGIAYKDSPSYREIRRMQTEFQNAGTSSLNIKGESS